MELTFKKAKEFFFDRMKVIEAVEKGKIDSLRRVGGFVKTAARRLMKKAARMKESELNPTQLALFQAGGSKPEDLPFRSSKPGEPPRVRKGFLKKGILFAYDPSTGSVVAGPVKYPIKGDAPSGLEHGGFAEVTVIDLNQPARKKGKPASPKQLAAFRRKRAAGTLRRRTTASKRKRRIKIEKRPYMSPALEKVRPVIATQFQDLIKS